MDQGETVYIGCLDLQTEFQLCRPIHPLSADKMLFLEYVGEDHSLSTVRYPGLALCGEIGDRQFCQETGLLV